jgi:hypothetical protein
LHVLNLPEPHSQPDAPLSWKLSWASPSPDQLVATLELDLAKGELDSASTARFQAQLQALYEALSLGPILERSR